MDMGGIAASAVATEDKIDLAPHGYAPGSSLFYCTDCQSEAPEQGHKFSTRCAGHALEHRLHQIRSGEAFLVPAEVEVAVLSLRSKVIIVAALSAFLWLLIGLAIKAVL